MYIYSNMHAFSNYVLSISQPSLPTAINLQIMNNWRDMQSNLGRRRVHC